MHDKYCGPHHGPYVGVGCCDFSPKDIARMKHMARRFIGGFMGSWIPHNIEDLGDRYLITVPLPGRAKEDVKVSLLDRNLNISAKKPLVPEEEKVEKKEEEGFPFSWKGFHFIDVNMDIPLPNDADENTIQSKMANGLLRITMGKKPAKSIDINEGSN